MNIFQRVAARLRLALFGTPDYDLRCAIIDAELDGDEKAAEFYSSELDRLRARS